MIRFMKSYALEIFALIMVVVAAAITFAPPADARSITQLFSGSNIFRVAPDQVVEITADLLDEGDELTPLTMPTSPGSDLKCKERSCLYYAPDSSGGESFYLQNKAGDYNYVSIARSDRYEKPREQQEALRDKYSDDAPAVCEAPDVSDELDSINALVEVLRARLE